MQWFIVEATNRPGEFARHAGEIAKRGINLANVVSLGIGDRGGLAFYAKDESGLRSALNDAGIGFLALLIIYLTLILLLGTVLDSGSTMLIMIPIAIPLFLGMEANGVDIVGLTWIGILTIIAVEIGLLTPPLGIACFVVHNTLQDKSISIGEIFRGAIPFALVMLLVLILVAAIPEVALLPLQLLR